MNNSWLIYVRIIVFLSICLFVYWLLGWLVGLSVSLAFDRKKNFSNKGFTEKVKLSFSWVALFPLGAEEILLIASCL